jgi:hypothetical protein
MAVMEFDDKGKPEVAKHLRALGVGSNLSVEKRVEIMQQRIAELIAALQKAGIKTE